MVISEENSANKTIGRIGPQDPTKNTGGVHILHKSTSRPLDVNENAAVTSTTSLPGEHSQGIQSIQTSRSVATSKQRSDQRGQRNGTESIEE